MVESRIDTFLHVSQVDNGSALAAPLFQRKFGAAPPTQGHHFLAFHRDAEGLLRVLGYTHFTPFGDIMLGGGACTDERVLRRMSAPERSVLAEAGGAYFVLLRYAMGWLSERCDAMFGYCGDIRAEAVDIRAGFEKTSHPHLLVHFHKPMHEVLQRALIAKAAAIGPF
ncbi:hypothetical protein [Chiayiivirga flava]|uniref:Uncharacterized protein n=1 Tax=Chiayiivirga flava TaxID=659595 RepID=A0A7W8G025_9GAMM|nr:hypothetical protein [Chiayiivirga flava]MBB5207819.1 hypothetical protein [Chiayiivirga flava]